MWNVCEVDNNDTRTMSLMSLTLLLTFNKFYTFTWSLIRNFDKINAGSVDEL